MFRQNESLDQQSKIWQRGTLCPERLITPARRGPARTAQAAGPGDPGVLGASLPEQPVGARASEGRGCGSGGSATFGRGGREGDHSGALPRVRCARRRRRRSVSDWQAGMITVSARPSASTRNGWAALAAACSRASTATTSGLAVPARSVAPGTRLRRSIREATGWWPRGSVFVVEAIRIFP